MAFVQAACSSTRIIRDDEYHTSQKYFEDKNFSSALDAFPRKEKNGFITTLEKNWIRLWDRQANSEELRKISLDLDERKVVKVSQEASTFFLRETEEGYFPSEHEVIILHLVTAMAFLDQSDFKTARIEVKKAAEVLQQNYNEKEEMFDDPALRLWLAALWASVGEWSEAQVDFRRIYELTKNKEALRLAESTKAPAELNLVLSGTDVKLDWPRTSTQPSFILPQRTIPHSELQFSTMAWYDWHSKRNFELRETLLKSNYMAQYTGIKTRSTSLKAAGAFAGGIIILTGVVVAAVIIGGVIYLAASTTGGGGDAVGYVAGGGVMLGSAIAGEGKSIAGKAFKQADEDEVSDFKNLQAYRMVRFLPQRIGISSVPLVNKPDQKIYRFPNYPTRVTIDLDVVP